ncbi:MAG: hypothetical protein M0Z99_24920 [Betaproteobacteria bacterium]|nr:hypothetical protein [Betaproteobacteria bacterium]
MQLRHALYGCALFILSCTGAVAQEDPEAVYAKLHGAALAGNAEEVMGFSTAAAKAEFTAKPQAERDALIRGLAQALPKTYTITEKNIAPDGNSAVLLGTGVSEYQTRATAYLTASFRKEGEAWKVSSWGWSNQKPPAPAAKPAAPAAAASAAEEPPAGTQIVRRLPAAAAPAKPEGTPASVSAANRPSRAHLDARACLKRATEKAVRACAEKYR